MFTIVLTSVLLCKLLFLLCFATDIASMVMVWSQKSIPLTSLWSQIQKTCMAIHIICDHKIAIHILHCSKTNQCSAAFIMHSQHSPGGVAVLPHIDVPYFYDKYESYVGSQKNLLRFNMFWFLMIASTQ